jgi:hypothetical protein
MHSTEHVGSRDNAPDLYAGGSSFEFQAQTLMSVTVVLLSHFRQMPGKCLKLGHYHFLRRSLPPSHC